jgi:hypothetical protein
MQTNEKNSANVYLKLEWDFIKKKLGTKNYLQQSPRIRKKKQIVSKF